MTTTATFRFERHVGQLIREVQVETAFLPQVGDSVNAYNVFDDVDADLAEEGWFFMVYEIRWLVDGGKLLPTVLLLSSKHADRKRVMATARGEIPT